MKTSTLDKIVVTGAFAVALTLGYCGRGAVGQTMPTILPPPGVTGATNPNVTQDNIDTTICVPNWTKSVRPAARLTTALKIKQLKELGYADQNPRDYEEDHPISLELGGAPYDINNLWPELYAGVCGARVKDKIEDELHRLVCSRAITLSEAQTAIATNWVAAYNRYLGPLDCNE